MYDLRGFRREYKLNQAQMADILGCGQSNVSMIEKSCKDLEDHQMEKLIEKYGRDSVMRFQVPTSAVQAEIVMDEQQNRYTTYLLPMSAMGGSLSGFASDTTTLQNCEAIVSPIENVDFAITVYGESMAPEYPSGSRVLIKKINPSIFIDWGRAYVLDTSNGVIVKEVHPSSKEGYVTCHSINPDPKFADFDVPLTEVYGMYRVLMCMSAK